MIGPLKSAAVGWASPVRSALALALVVGACLYSLAGGLAALRASPGPGAEGTDRAGGGTGVAFQQFVDFASTEVPASASYLFQEPWGRGNAHRLRYELYPRRYERLSADASEQEVRAFVRARAIDYILVFDSSVYPSAAWVSQARPWFLRRALGPSSFVLKVIEP